MRTCINNKNGIIKSVAVAGTMISIISLVITVVSGCFIMKLLRYINTAQKAVPVMEKAAQLYIQNNEKSTEPDAPQSEEEDS